MNKPSESKVPKSRLARFSRLTALATSVAGGMVAEGARQLAQGKRPKLSHMLLTPANARRVADQLAQLRGAAMKVGQLLSMDAGDLLPPELSDILARLRSDAKMMPRSQLESVLKAHWGEGWHTRLRYFSWTPMAAASIGQVHEAISLEGKRLAIKIQYPGVRESINSDIDNVASLLRVSGVLPKTLNIQPLLEEAKKQLAEEADYLREAQCLKAYAQALKGHDDYLIPEVFDELSCSDILAMSHVEGVPVESLDEASLSTRNRVGYLTFDLLFRELFDMRMMQTDPNFANYRYNTQTGQLVLLDFGATRHFTEAFTCNYSRLVDAALACDRAAIDQSAMDIGFYDATVLDKHRQLILDLIELSCEPLQAPSYTFGETDLASRIRDKGIDLGIDRDFWHVPPVDSIFLNRKLGGVFLLASRLRCEVPARALLERARASGAGIHYDEGMGR